MIPGPGLIAEGAKMTCCGEPNRAVPRVTTADDRTRDSTGTRIGAAGGGAVRLASSAGDRIREPTTHPTAELSTTATITATARIIRLIAAKCAHRFLTGS